MCLLLPLARKGFIFLTGIVVVFHPTERFDRYCFGDGTPDGRGKAEGDILEVYN